MSRIKGTILAIAVFTAVAVNQDAAASSNNPVMEQDFELVGGHILTPDLMWKMGRIGGFDLSPDGGTVVYAVTYYDMDENRGSSSLYLVDFNVSEPRRITAPGHNDSSPVWSRDGRSIYFMSDRSGSGQAWVYDVASGSLEAMSDIEGGIDGFGISPDGSKAYYYKQVKVGKVESADIYPDMDKSKALIYDDLMARHWNYWDRGEYYHIFVTDVRDGKFGEGRDIMPGEPWDAPMAPYFDASEIAWNNSGTVLAYTCKKMTGTEYAVSTDSDIYLYDLATGTTENLTEGMVGYDKYPVFSPDDTKLAFTSMERPGNEADKERLFVHDFATGRKSYLTRDFDYNAANILWESNESLLFIAPITATHQICRVTLDGKVEVITEGLHDINHIAVAGNRAVGAVTRINMATELLGFRLENGSNWYLTQINKDIYDGIKLGEVRERWVETTDGKRMLVWVILPPDFDETKKYPALLYCQGGPQSVVSQSWSYRWNFQLMAAQGYVVVAPNRRGLPSFGQEWLDQISGDYSGQNIHDYLSAIDDVAAEPWVDETRLGCVGASYGGYSAFFLAGNDGGRFKGIIAHCGIFNFESMYGHTEELFFVNNDYGGPYWSDDPTAQRSYANSPHKFVRNWHAPILIITGLNDYRIPYTQSLEAFTAARLMDIPARLVAFENEAHQVFKPQNSIVWNREFFRWLDRYVKNP
ncbi:MAG: S9 family peptidase [Rikenellaceae bacterium]|nr:S9 family peptidase [Rikenellaceae bacterium]